MFSKRTWDLNAKEFVSIEMQKTARGHLTVPALPVVPLEPFRVLSNV